ncbi:putative toxin-antitoxin system toxin component, PIN family [Virgibacillus sp. NKC19-16]|uniref:putative toxin-antitoxin system toxin component, PIN family n=1 Tax=Virgibacillus salidurans TaxID=2831673 RepID=UPI001F41B2E3|nr:putative toxin-antitoxin system toxin component, PIN family [Virgibacillus sp. NKC19-16]UJL46958.1 putative toxin-antitoxin system toxin component, PIN family [Virgibacillus sp. NKC19-16]
MNETGNKIRVFIDSNILISALLSEKSHCRRLIRVLIQDHILILSSYSIDEVSRVLKRKFPDKLVEWDYMLSNIDFELAYSPEDISLFDVPHIRDEEDLPILLSALNVKPDIFVTGDKDFHTEEIQEFLVVYTPADFLRDFT